jgi:hypothetical protein
MLTQLLLIIIFRKKKIIFVYFIKMAYRKNRTKRSRRNKRTRAKRTRSYKKGGMFPSTPPRNANNQRFSAAPPQFGQQNQQFGQQQNQQFGQQNQGAAQGNNFMAALNSVATPDQYTRNRVTGSPTFIGAPSPMFNQRF